MTDVRMIALLFHMGAPLNRQERVGPGRRVRRLRRHEPGPAARYKGQRSRAARIVPNRRTPAASSGELDARRSMPARGPSYPLTLGRRLEHPGPGRRPHPIGAALAGLFFCCQLRSHIHLGQSRECVMPNPFFHTYEKERNTLAMIILGFTVATIVVALAWAFA